MVKCPHCGQTAQIPDVAKHNVDLYQKAEITIVTCCGRGVWLWPLISYEISKAGPNTKEDNWGNKLNPPA